ncbi:hypothetical protein CG709_07100 [Lachnotalea glycerini]|nr:hypothetical protein CG709_07100 [Lachnotalea glycerini]
MNDNIGKYAKIHQLSNPEQLVFINNHQGLFTHSEISSSCKNIKMSKAEEVVRNHEYSIYNFEAFEF